MAINQNYYLQTLTVYIKNKYDNKSKLFFTNTDSLMYEIKTEDVYEDFSGNKEMFDFSNYSTSQNAMMIQINYSLEKWKMKSEALWLKNLLDWSLEYIVDNNEHKKSKGANKNVIATVSHNEYRGVLLNNKYMRHSMNRIQSKDHRIGTYEINKISFSCFGDKKYFQANRYDGLALGY